MTSRRGILRISAMALMFLNEGQIVEAKAAQAPGDSLERDFSIGRFQELFRFHYTGVTGMISHFAVDRSGATLVAFAPTGADMTVVDARSGKIIEQLEAPFLGGAKPAQSAIHFLDDGATLCWPHSADGHGTMELVLFSVSPGSAGVKGRIRLPGAPVADLRILGNKAFVLKMDGDVLVVNLQSGETRQLLQGHFGVSLTSSPSGEVFLVSGPKPDPNAQYATLQDRLQDRPLTVTPLSRGEGGGEITLPPAGYLSLVGPRADGGWIVVTPPNVVTHPDRGSRLLVTDGAGKLLSETEFSTPVSPPGSLSIIGGNAFVSGIGADQPIRLFSARDGKFKTSSRVPNGALELIAAGGRLFFRNPVMIGVFG